MKPTTQTEGFTKTLEAITLEAPKGKLDGKQGEIRDTVTKLLSLEEGTRINVIPTIPAMIISNGKDTLTYSNDPEAPGILTLSMGNETISLSGNIILLMNKILQNARGIVNSKKL